MKPGQEKYAGRRITYVPYWRFKGLEFSLGGRSPSFRVMDYSCRAVENSGLPVSLGLRSQTQKLEFIRKDMSGSFVTPDISRKDILKQISGSGNKKIHIGEVLSLIFMPFYQDNDIVYDGLSGKALAISPSDLSEDKTPSAFSLEFTPGLCPDCGWDLKGETDSLVLCCGNCMSFWHVHNKTLNKIKALFYGTGTPEDMLMPFFRLQIEFQTLECSTYAQLIKIANIPKVICDEDKKVPLYFYVPAFKISPKLFLRIGRQITLAGIEPLPAGKMPAMRFHPADLPIEECFQAILPLFMELCTKKKEIWSLLEKEKLKLTSFCLTYISFQTSGSDYIQESLGIGLPKNSLKFGRNL